MTTENIEATAEVPENEEVAISEKETTSIVPEILDLDPEIRLDVSALGKELEKNKSLNKFIEGDKFNMTKALKSLQNAEKLIGKRIDEADPEALKGLLSKFDIPASEDEYEIEADEDKAKFFKKIAKEAGVPKEAAKKLFAELNKAPDEAEILAKEKLRIETEIKALQEEFGDSFDAKKQAANKAVELFGSDDLKTVIAKTGLGTNPSFIKFMASVGEKFQTKNIETAQETAPIRTEADLRAEALAIMKSPEYANNRHPDHEKAITRRAEIYKILYGGATA